MLNTITTMNKKFALLSSCVVLLLLAFSSHITIKTFSENLVDTIAPIIFAAKDHQGKNVVSTSGVITLSTGLHNDYYQADSPGKTGYLYVEARLSKFSNGNVKRIPLNISIVIDRSASMEGTKMGYAKKAAKTIIDRLSADDLVSIVVYDTYVDTIQSPVHVIDKEKIKARIDRIVPRASTNLWGGAEQGYQYVQKNYKPDCINRVLLISDGNANTGLTDSAIIRLKVQNYKDDNGITLSTFGVGLDYNETLMTTMAESGAGNYYFIDRAEKLSEIFNNELNGLMNIAAQNAELKIKLPQGTKMLSVYPLPYQQNDDGLIFNLRDLSPEETKATLIHFSIQNQTHSVLKFKSSLSYTDVLTGGQKIMRNENNLAPAKKTDDYLTHFNKPVIQQIILFSVNEKLETAMRLMEKRDFKSAKMYLNQNHQYLQSNANYVSNNAALMKTDSLNRDYFEKYSKAFLIHSDSVKKFQKVIRAINYKLRSKKQ